MPTEEEKAWIAAWRRAGPELERIRREELRRLDDQAGLRLMGATRAPVAESNGLVTFQAWMMRWRVLELMKDLESR